jgi:hypothetical protein
MDEDSGDDARLNVLVVHELRIKYEDWPEVFVATAGIEEPFFLSYLNGYE